MLIDSLKLVEGSGTTNLIVPLGTDFPSSPNEGELFYKTSAPIGLHFYGNSTWNLINSGVQLVKLNALSAADGASTIANANNPITWNWTQTTATQNAIKIGESSASLNGTGNQVMLNVGTVNGSSANPFRVEARGATAIDVTAAGRFDVYRSVSEHKVEVTATATTNLDFALGNNFNIAMSANITTLQFTNVPAAGRVATGTLFLNYAGNFSVTWPGSIKWSGSAPTLTSTNLKTDIISLVTHDGGVTWFGFVGGLNF